MNRLSMDYTVWEVDYSANGNFVPLGEDEKGREVWKVGDSQIITPHGTLGIKDIIFVEQGPLVGLQFSVYGTLKMNDFKCSNGCEEDIQVSTLALMRQSHNTWLWAYAFDEDNTPVANFYGTDLIDGLANFVSFLKRKHLKKQYY